MRVEGGDIQARGPGARECELERGSAVSNGGKRWFKVRSGAGRGLERGLRSVRSSGVMSHIGTGLWIEENMLRRRCASSRRGCGAKVEVDELGSSSWVGNSIVDVGRVVEPAAGRVRGSEG
jgi:hypothetical protein